MAASDTGELHCPWCNSGLGIREVPAGDQAIECPGCHQRFYAEASGSTEETAPSSAETEIPEGALDDYLTTRVRGHLPETKDERHLPSKSGDAREGWSKWEHSAPKKRSPDFSRDIRNTEDNKNLPAPAIEFLSKGKKEAPKFNEFGRSRIPEEREIDAEQRRRKEVLRRGWDHVSENKERKGPTLTKKDALRFERNLVSTQDRHGEPEPHQPERHRLTKDNDRLKWEDDAVSEADLEGFSVEKMERAQRMKSFFVGVLGLAAILVVAAGIVFAFSKFRQQEVNTETSPVAVSPGSSVYSIPDNYNAIISRVREFLEAEDVDSLVATVRNREQTEPLLRSYYNKHPYKPHRLRDQPSHGNIVVADGFVIVDCVVENDQRMWIPMEIASGLRVDWEAVVGYSDMDWEDFAATKPKAPALFRVSLAPDNYYNYGFTEDKFISIRVADREMQHVYYGYIPRKGKLFNEFVQLVPGALGIGTARENLLAVVELRFPDEASGDNQVEITALRARGWTFRRDLKARTQSLELFANDARIEGGGARMDESLRIVDWDRRSTTIEWSVAIERPVHVQVFALLANGGVDQSKGLILTAGPQTLKILNQNQPAIGTLTRKPTLAIWISRTRGLTRFA